MPESATLELRLRRKDAQRFTVEFVVDLPESEANVHPLGPDITTTTFDFESLRALWPDVDGYGLALGAMLLGEPAIAAAFASCRSVAESRKLPLRLRVDLAPDADELHALIWEALRDPRTGRPLALSEHTVLARAVSSADWRPVTLRAQTELKALAVIAAPAGLERYALAPIDVEAETRIALTALDTIPTTVLARPAEASLALIEAELRKGSFDILYLLAHGRLDDDEPVLFLDDGGGNVEPVSGLALLESISNLSAPPRLIVLASCESGGNLSDHALTALGPRLVASGVPAVIAAQGRLSIETNARFASALFKELREHGEIDRAVAVGRRSIAKRPDWWAPALFTRLRSGRIWYRAGFDLAEEFEKWPGLFSAIENGKCTPILGPGLLDRYLGSTRDLARRLAVEHRFPLAPFARDDLPQVAQFLVVQQGLYHLHVKLVQALGEALAAHADEGELPGGDPDQMLSAMSARRRAGDPSDPYRVLASLPLPVFISANSDRLLIDALIEAGKRPQVVVCPWNVDLGRPLEYINASRDEPLVYYPFGRLDDPDTLVLTEDDYFRYLIGVTRNQELVPTRVNAALTNASLLFIGFRLDDWNFRALFQSAMDLRGSGLRNRFIHVAVQVDPQEGMMLDPKAARKYVHDYFHGAAGISIYWGSAEDFLRELARRAGSRRGR